MPINVWWDIWRCTHAKLALQTPHPLPWLPQQACIVTRGERFEAGNLSAPISPLLLKCADGATTLSLRLGSQTLVVNWLPDVSEVDRTGSSSASVAGLLKANTDGGGACEVQHWVLGGGGYGPPLPLPRFFHLVAHCQNDKSGHLVSSFCAFQHNRDQTVRCKRLFAHLW